MQKTALGLVFLASLFLVGCPATDLQPLYTASDSVVEPALVGKWSPSDPQENVTIEFAKSTGNSYTMVVADPDEAITDTYDVHLVRLGGNLFADFRFAKRNHTGKDKDIDLPIGIISAHMVIKLQIVNDDMAYSTMEDTPLQKKSAADKPLLPYLDYSPDGILVTADTDALRGYVTAHATDGFSDTIHWRRVSK